MSDDIAPSAADDDALIHVEAEPSKQQRRRCVAARAPKDRRKLIRFVIGPDDRLVADVDARLPGRGLWLSADAESLKTAIARSLFQKAARRRVVVDLDLPERLDAQLEARCRQWLGLARRAGEVVMGFEQVAAAAKMGGVAVLVIASDAGHDGTAKLVRRRPAPYHLVTLLDRHEIGSALGRDALVYAGLAEGRLAGRLWDDAERLAGLRGDTTSVRPASLEMIETA